MITIVTGMTRCGSSLMMRCLHRGGVPVYASNTTSYEHDDMLTLPQHTAWLDRCQGHAVKVLDAHRYRLPPGRAYRTILLTRNPDEQAKSIVKFTRLLKLADIPDTAIPQLALSLREDLPRLQAAMCALGPVLQLTFEDLVTLPHSTLQQVNTFCEDALDLQAMRTAIIPRSPLCYPGLLELQERQEVR